MLKVIYSTTRLLVALLVQSLAATSCIKVSIGCQTRRFKTSSLECTMQTPAWS